MCVKSNLIYNIFRLIFTIISNKFVLTNKIFNPDILFTLTLFLYILFLQYSFKNKNEIYHVFQYLVIIIKKIYINSIFRRR